jgi:hypothetical protein
MERMNASYFYLHPPPHTNVRYYDWGLTRIEGEKDKKVHFF